MKKILALSAVAALTAGVSAYAANPFSDVSADHWAYQAVADLSAQGVVEGYPNGTFQGENHITRYEMAQIVARMMAQESQMNAAQKATVDKLAAEYADELVNLGVRVSNIEEKMGNVKFTGDARVKFARDFSKAVGEKDSYEGRLRLKISAKANDKVEVKTRLSTKYDIKSGKKFGTIEVDNLHAIYKPIQGVSFDFGRQNLKLGSSALYDGKFDGIVAAYDMGKFNVEAGYGRLRKGIQKDKEVVYTQGGLNLSDKASVGAFYTRFEEEANKNLQFVGVNAKVNLVKGLVLDGEYGVNTEKDGENHRPEFWNVGASYVYGPFSLGLHHYEFEENAHIGKMGSTLGVQAPEGAKFNVASASAYIAQGVKLKADYRFKGEKKDANKTKIDNAVEVSLNYMF